VAWRCLSAFYQDLERLGTMAELIRDTAFGLRFASRGKFLQYQEERDPSIWTKFVNEKQSGYLAHHGTTDPPEDGEEPETLGGIRTREEQSNEKRSESNSSSQTRVGEGHNVNRASGVKVDSEKGKDLEVISWYGDADPENPQNWSLPKKCFVTFEICLLTTSIYIGSSIYSAGTQSVMATFGVSQVAATLGLTLFVAGYGLGPMIWSPMSEVSIARLLIGVSTVHTDPILDSPNRKESHLPRDSPGIRGVASAYSTGVQLRHVARVSIHNGFRWIARACDRRCFPGRHLEPTETCLRNEYLGRH
jgi:DHA1 family multidrug resistance protein-like MFS transporter